MTNEVKFSIETRAMGDIAREEIAAARRAGVDPLEIAETHSILARLIPAMIEHGLDKEPAEQH